MSELNQPTSEGEQRPLTLDDVALNIASLYKIVDGAMSESKPEWLPCQAGCSWCCYSINTTVTWVEAMYLARDIMNWNDEAIEDLKKRAQAEVTMLLADKDIAAIVTEGDIKPDGREKYAKAMRRHIRPCPMLDIKTGKCRAYTSRFLACRLFGQTVAHQNKEPALYGCNVVMEDVQTHPETQFYDAEPFVRPLYQMSGAPNVYAMPVAFWINELIQGEVNNMGFSLRNPDPMFERFMQMFNPIILNAERKEAETT